MKSLAIVVTPRTGTAHLIVGRPLAPGTKLFIIVFTHGQAPHSFPLVFSLSWPILGLACYGWAGVPRATACPPNWTSVHCTCHSQYRAHFHFQVLTRESQLKNLSGGNEAKVKRGVNNIVCSSHAQVMVFILIPPPPPHAKRGVVQQQRAQKSPRTKKHTRPSANGRQSTAQHLAQSSRVLCFLGCGDPHAPTGWPSPLARGSLARPRGASDIGAGSYMCLPCLRLGRLPNGTSFSLPLPPNLIAALPAATLCPRVWPGLAWSAHRPAGRISIMPLLEGQVPTPFGPTVVGRWQFVCLLEIYIRSRFPPSPLVTTFLLRPRWTLSPGGPMRRPWQGLSDQTGIHDPKRSIHL